jgi:hypothetical protein
MRKALLALLMLVLAAGPATAQKSRSASPLTGGTSAGLRGPVGADSSARGSMTPAPALPVAPPLPALLAPLATAPASDPSQCRAACAQSYYFCLSTEVPENCPGDWGQCRAACAAPTLGWSADRGL